MADHLTTDDEALGPQAPRVTGSPDEIWLVYGELDDDATHAECSAHDDVTWCENQQFDTDVRYVRADAITTLRAECDALRDALEAWEGASCGGDCLAAPCRMCDGTMRIAGKGERLGSERDEARAEVDALREQLSQALTVQMQCPKDHHWGPGPDPRPECSAVVALREQVAALTAALTELARTVPIGLGMQRVVYEHEAQAFAARALAARNATSAAPTVETLLQQTRELIDSTRANPGQAVPVPELVAVEGRKFMRGEPSLFDKVPLGDMQNVSEAILQAAEPMTACPHDVPYRWPCEECHATPAAATARNAENCRCVGMEECNGDCYRATPAAEAAICPHCDKPAVVGWSAEDIQRGYRWESDTKVYHCHMAAD